MRKALGPNAKKKNEFGTAEASQDISVLQMLCSWMDAPKQFCFHIKDFECDFWKKPLEKSEDILAACILLFKHIYPQLL